MFDVLQFYNDLSSDYHLMFENWKHSVERQGKILDSFIRQNIQTKPQTLLDCSCGIGTQSIGLALLGYHVRATDLSPVSVERLKTEAKNFGVEISAGVADLRDLSTVAGEFDLVLSCDNSVSHLMNDSDLNKAAREIYTKVKPGGYFLASIRDYDALTAERPTSTLPTVSENEDGRKISFQIWNWADDMKTYELELFMFIQTGDQWETKKRKGSYRALLRTELDAALKLAGFREIHWHFPDTSGYYQPIVLAQK